MRSLLALFLACTPTTDEAPCRQGAALTAADAPCTCGEGTFDPDETYVDGTCGCLTSGSLDCCTDLDTEWVNGQCLTPS